jgi:predicted DsbA family dithiol-disulfide isomerase
MESTPTLHIWHDYVCPFCNVEATRIARIKREENLDLAVRFRPWPLEVADGRQPRAEDEDQWVQLLRPLEPDAFAHWNPDTGIWPETSRLLFAAYEAALVQDVWAAERFDLLIRQVIFRQPRPIASLDALSELADQAGLDVARFRTMLQDGSAERQAQSAGADAERLGIRGIPTLVLPDGSQARAPGLKIQRTAEGRSIRDDLDTLRELLRRTAGAHPTATGHA